MRIETEGLILKSFDTGESDRLLTILTRDYGVVRAFANGAKKLKSRVLGATQPLSFSRLSIYRNRDTYTVDEAQCIESFFKLREDITALSLAQYFCELAAFTAPQDAQADAFLCLILNALYLLVHQKRPQALLKAVVELRMLCLAGYQPDLSVCVSCAEHANAEAQTLTGEFVCLNLCEGVMTCSVCVSSLDVQTAANSKDAVNRSHAAGEVIGLGVLAAMRHICSAPPERLFAFQLPVPSLQSLARVCEAYSETQLERRFATLDFYHSLAETT